MLFDYPIKCLCEFPPELKRREIPPGCAEPYYFYECDKCNINTFATRKEEFCRELWNAAITRKKS